MGQGFASILCDRKPDINNITNMIITDFVYRPVPFLSKIVEKVVATRLEGDLSTHKLHDDRLSAYREDRGP